MTAKPPITVVHDDDTLRISTSAARPGGAAVVSFTGIGAKADVVQDEEFRRVGSAGDRHAVFVTDKSRSWYNTQDQYEQIVAAVRDLTADAASVVTIGNSMGGFGALLFAEPLGARVAVAFAPQVSIDRRVIPQEKRWSEHVGAIASIRFTDVNAAIGATASYVVLHGSRGRDAFQIAALKPRENLRHYVMRSGRHNVAADLKDRGALGPIVAAAVAERWAELDALVRKAGFCDRAQIEDIFEEFEARRRLRA